MEEPFLKKRVFLSIGDDEFRTKYFQNGFADISRWIRRKTLKDMMSEQGAVINVRGTLLLFPDKLLINSCLGPIELPYREIDSLRCESMHIRIEHHAHMKRFVYIRGIFGSLGLFSDIMAVIKSRNLELRAGKIGTPIVLLYLLFSIAGSVVPLVVLYVNYQKGMLPVMLAFFIPLIIYTGLLKKAWPYVDM